MQIEKLKEYQSWIQTELFDHCLPFWLKNGMDRENGGVYTSLDRSGKIFATDKSVWFQGRVGWIFAHLCNVYGVHAEWLEASKSCIDFMEKYCFDPENGRMYFTVTADGKPLRQRRYWFSETFYIIANAEYSVAANDPEAMERARKIYDLVYRLNNGLISDPTGFPPKTNPETRPGRSLANPMIFLNVTAIMRRCDPANREFYDERAKECINEIFSYHVKPELKGLLEMTGPNGEFYDCCSAGRVMNPGHDIEASWFIMEEANYEGNQELYKKAIDIFDWSVERGWDETYGGILAFIDIQGWPPEQYEHDMKLWWPQCELLIASLMIYRDTGDEKYLKWFEKCLDYCKKYFSDPEYGDWFGYLRRDGKFTEPPCKGSTFKGPFHLPRMLIIVDQILQELIERESK